MQERWSTSLDMCYLPTATLSKRYRASLILNTPIQPISAWKGLRESAPGWETLFYFTIDQCSIKLKWRGTFFQSSLIKTHKLASESPIKQSDNCLYRINEGELISMYLVQRSIESTEKRIMENEPLSGWKSCNIQIRLPLRLLIHPKMSLVSIINVANQKELSNFERLNIFKKVIK